MRVTEAIESGDYKWQGITAVGPKVVAAPNYASRALVLAECISEHAALTTCDETPAPATQAVCYKIQNTIASVQKNMFWYAY